jgi:hypothetical protein
VFSIPHISRPAERVPFGRVVFQEAKNPMVSNTQQTDRRRYNRDRRLAKARKRASVRRGTQSFPIHPEGYDATAADAKPQQA